MAKSGAEGPHPRRLSRFWHDARTAETTVILARSEAGTPACFVSGQTMIEKYGALRSERDVARLLGVSVRTLQRWRRDGGGPAFIRLGSRRIGYSDTEIERWAASRSFASLAAELAAARQPAA